MAFTLNCYAQIMILNDHTSHHSIQIITDGPGSNQFGKHEKVQFRSGSGSAKILNYQFGRESYRE